MAIDFTCPVCGTEIEADETVAGSKAQCPKCHGTVMIPRRGIRPGMTVGSYVIDRKLGVGGMGEVWLAQHGAMKRAVALKILSPAMTADPEFVTRFRHEVETAAKLEHPNIVTAFDAGQAGDIHYLAVSYVDGEEVGARLRRQKALPEVEVLQIGRGVAEALAYAWNKFQMLHRDIKPSNIMLTKDGVPKLMDMGISKSMAEDVQLTMTGYIVGTPQYMSPEQARADAEIDFRSDIYALGATLYHLVTGTLPFSGTTTMSVLTKHITEPLESPRKRNPVVTEGFSALIETMMAKDPKDRPDSWEDVVRDVGLVLRGKMPASHRPAMGASMVTRMTPEDLKSLRTNRAQAAVSARDLRQALGQKPSAAPVQSSSLKPALLAAAAVVVAAGIGVGIYLATRGSQVAPTPSPRGVQPVPAPVAAPVPPSAKETDKIAEMWDYAAQYTKEHPRDYEVAMGHFRTVKEQAPGTKYQLMADVEIRRLEQAQREALGAAAAKVMEDLSLKARPLVTAEDYAGAAAVYTGYSGPMAKETEGERGKLAAEYGKRTDQVAVEKAKAADTARQKVGQALNAAAADLLGGRAADALAKVQDLARESLPASEQEQVKKAVEVVQGLAGVDAMVLKSFEAQMGQEVAVPLAGGVQRVTITRIRDGMVQAERRVEQASVGVSFSPRQLSEAERSRRLQGQAAPEVYALYMGLAAFARGSDEEAAKLLAGSEALAPALQAAMNAHVQGHKGEAARQALAKALKPMGIAGNDLSWPAVSNLLVKVKWTQSSATSAQQGLEAYRKDYGTTAFATGQKDLLDQLAAFLAAKAAPPEPPSVVAQPDPPVPKPVLEPVVKQPAQKTPVVVAPIKESPYKTPESLNEALKKVNPNYKGDAKIEMEDGRIVTAYIPNEITDISPLRGVPLTSLELGRQKVSQVADFSPLAGMPLKSIWITCSAFGDEAMKLLAPMPLEKVYLWETSVTGLSALKGKAITFLYIKTASNLRDITPLRGMSIEVLGLVSCNISDLTPIQGMPLRDLRLTGNRQLADLSLLPSFKSLTILDISGLEGVKDFAFLKDMPFLKELNIASTPFTDFFLLKGKQLEVFRFSTTNIRNRDDLKILREMKSLRKIGFENSNGPSGLVHYKPAEFWKKYDAGEFK